MTIVLGAKEMALLYGLLMLGAAFLCFWGYRIYRFALSILGFAAGFSLSQPYLEFFKLSEGGVFLGQLIVGLICAVLSWRFLRAGVFLAVYHVARLHLGGLLSKLLADRLDIPVLLYPVFAAVAGAVIALLLAFLVVRSERIIVVIVLSVAGGFAAISLLREFANSVLPLLPESLHIDPSLPDRIPGIAWTLMKILLSLAGIFSQGLKKKK